VQATPTSSTRQRAELLLPTLMELKSWVRQLGQQLRTEHPTATLATLALIERHGPARISDLAEVARVDTSVVSRIAKSLEQAGLVERHSDPADGRAHRLEISAAGRDVLESGRREMADHMADRLSGWTDDELEELNAALLRLLRDLGRTPDHG
jgi:DNA-binding MarR family transcriptional regulator